MSTELEYVPYSEFVAGLSTTENPTSADKTVISNPTNGPRAVPGSAKDLAVTATEADLVSGNYITLDGGAGKKKLPANMYAVAKNFEKEIADENVTLRFSTGDDTGVTLIKGARYKLYAKCTTATDTGTIYVFGTRVGTDPANYIATCTKAQIQAGFTFVYDCDVEGAKLYVGAGVGSAGMTVEVRVDRIIIADSIALAEEVDSIEKDLTQVDSGTYSSDSAGLLPTFRHPLKDGVKYTISVKSDVLVSYSGNIDVLWTLTENDSLISNIAQCSPQKLYDGFVTEYTAAQDCVLAARARQSGVDLTISVSYSRLENFVTESQFDQLAEDVDDLKNAVDTSLYEIETKTITPNGTTNYSTGIILKQGVEYTLTMQTATLLAKTGTFPCAYAYPTDGSAGSAIFQSTASDLLNGITFTYTPVKESRWDIRTWEANVLVSVSAVGLKDVASKGYVDAKCEEYDALIPLKNKTWAAYGDSITAISNGDTLTLGWAKYVNGKIPFAGFHGRGIGSSKYSWGSAGGTVAFVDSTTGAYNSQNNNYSKDNYTGSIPEGCVAIRSCYCSWDRITHMFPASIKDTIDVVCIMGGTNDLYDDTAATFVDNDITDPEWAASGSDYYGKFNGDYNITTFKGGIASCIMKFQTWMPNAVIVICTPLSGRGEVGQKSTDLNPDEYPKVSVIKEMAERTSCPCIDVYGTCGISPFNRDEYITDMVHPYSDAGRKMLARAFIMGLKTIEPMID